MNDINAKVVMLKGESGSSISNIEKTATDGLIDTYTITLTDGKKYSFNVTNGNGIKSIGKTGTSGLVDTYTITFDNGSTTRFDIKNGMSADGFYDVEFNNGGIVTPNGFLSEGIKSELSTSTTTFEKGLYLITYDVFLFSTQNANSTGEVFLTADDGSAQVNTSSIHKIVAPMFGDLAFGIILPYTDFIELSKPSKVNINIGNLAGNGVSACLGSNDGGDDYQPTVIKLR